jgi:hypothetical protein
MIEWTALIPYLGLGGSLILLHLARQSARKRVNKEREKQGLPPIGLPPIGTDSGNGIQPGSGSGTGYSA